MSHAMNTLTVDSFQERPGPLTQEKDGLDNHRHHHEGKEPCQRLPTKACVVCGSPFRQAAQSSWQQVVELDPMYSAE